MTHVFQHDRPCEKCGGTAATIRYCPGAGVPAHVAGCDMNDEHLHRVCATCSFEWLELPLDATP